jgi:hypothetical protein
MIKKAGIGKPRKRENGKMEAKHSFNKNCWVSNGPDDDGQRPLHNLDPLDLDPGDFPGGKRSGRQGATAPR